MACDAHATLDWPSSTECPDSAVDGKGTSVTAVADLPPNRVERYIFWAALTGERAPFSSIRASRPDPVLRCALCSRNVELLRGE